MLGTLAAAWMAIQAGAGTPPVAAVQPAPAVVAIAGKTLQNLPNTTVRYFDVTGSDLKAINKSMADQAQSRARAAPTNWSIDTTFNKVTTDGRCKIASAKATFAANVGLPRLVPNPAHKPQMSAAWRAYVAGIEKAQAANLWFVHDRVSDVEKAIVASSCEGAQAAGAAAVARLKAQAAEFQQATAQPAPAAK
jgi:predicted secreted Zn-dependent protease